MHKGERRLDFFQRDVDFESKRSKQENFNILTSEKFDLWLEMVKDSQVDDETKKSIQEILIKLRDEAFAIWGNLGDAVYGTLNVILNAALVDSNKAEAYALFENIRDDMHSMEKELRDPVDD